MSDVAVEEFLEHFGTKGMKWGVRNSRPASGSNGKSEKPKHSKKKIAVGVAAVAVGVGAVAVGVILAKNNKVKVADIQRTAKLKAQNDIIKRHMEAQMKRDPVFATMTPAKLMAQHNASKAEFDRFLTVRERDLGYLYKGPK